RSVAHRGRLKCSSFDADDVSQEALHRFVRGASHIHPYNVHGFIMRLIDRSAGDLNRTACRAKRGGGRTVHASVYWSDDRDGREGRRAPPIRRSVPWPPRRDWTAASVLMNRRCFTSGGPSSRTPTAQTRRRPRPGGWQSCSRTTPAPSRRGWVAARGRS